jgi:alanine or glycine:cation symporter, AGCS family
MEHFVHLVIKLNGLLWAPLVLFLIVGVHLFFTIRLRGIQRYIPRAIRLSLTSERSGHGDVTPFGSLCTAMASTVSVGSVIGVTTSILVGGPGSVVWMLLFGILAMPTKYAESLLTLKYRRKNRKGAMLGGPMLVFENGLGQKWLGRAFCVLLIGLAFCIGNMLPSNSVAHLIEERFKVDTWVSGACLAIFSAIIIIGGVRSIARVCMRLVPAIVVFYVGGCLLILFTNSELLFPALSAILKSAFSPQAAGGGFAGATLLVAVRNGFMRGTFPIDAGLGSTPFATAVAQNENPAEQALISSSGTIWDSIIVGGLTGLVVVTGLLKHAAFSPGDAAIDLTEAIFMKTPGIGPLVFTVSILALAFSTTIAWAFYSERAIEYLTGRKSIPIFRYFWVIAIFFGSMLKPVDESAFSNLLANSSLTFIALLTLPNLISLVYLNKTVVDETKQHLWDIASKKTGSPSQSGESPSKTAS